MTPVEVGLVLISALLHAGWNVAARESPNPSAYLLALEAAALLLLAPVLAEGLYQADLPRTVWVLALASALVHAFYVHWLARAYASGEVALVYPIVRSTPAFVPFLAVPLLGERVSPVGAVGIVCVVASLWLLAAPRLESAHGTRERRRPSALGFALLALATTVAYALIDREAMRRLGAAPWATGLPRAVVYLALFELLYLPLFAALSWRHARPRAVLEIARRRPGRVVGGTLAGLASYALVLHVLQSAPASYVVAVRQTSVLFAVAIAAVALREHPNRTAWSAAALNLSGVLMIAL